MYNSSVKSLKDPRNLESKREQEIAVSRVYEFLMERCYDQPISITILSRPTSAVYLNVLKFILKQLDPSLNISDKNSNEIVAILKFLKYPFTVSRTTVSSIGSPHSWPTLLGILIWLVELIDV